MKQIIALLVICTSFLACEKEEGQGGTSTIKGEVIVWEYNRDFTIKRGTYPGQDVNVYLMYGNDEVHGDRFRTGYDGKYEFNYLREGTYTVYAMSKDTLNLVNSELIPIMQTVTISGKNQVVTVPVIIIAD
jgi:hypothetical protein